MSISIRVNVGDLDRVAAKLKDKSEVFEQVGQMADHKLQQTHSAGQNPFGETWASLKSGGPSFLRSPGGGHLESSRNVDSDANSAKVAYGTDYSKYHQTGTSKMPQRQLVPDDGIPPDWEQEIQDIVDGWASSL